MKAKLVLCLAVLSHDVEAVRIGVIKKVNREEVDLGDNPDNFDKFEQETNV